MLSLNEAQNRADALVSCAKTMGADAADAVYIADASESVSIRLGKLENVERSESEHIGLRVFIGKRSASIGSSDLSDAALDLLAERAVAMARAAPEDPYAGLAPQELLMQGPILALDMEDSSEPSPQMLRQWAEEAEDAARSVEGVTNSEGGSAGAGRAIMALATSHGFSGGYGGTSRSISASVIAGEGSHMQRDYAWRSTRFTADLPQAQEIGQRAGRRAVERLNPGRVKSGVMPVVFDPRVSGSLLSPLLGAMSGMAIARKASFLMGHENGQLFGSAITICDDPHRPRGLRSRPFDGEGLPTNPRNIIENGRLTGWLMESASARQLGQMPSGHAARGGNGAPSISSSNLHLAAGELSPAALMADIADGIYITEMIGHGVNGVTGDYSRGASGFRIINGEIAGPVAEFTVAGNLIDIYANLIPANDLEMYHVVNAPTVRVDGLTIAGD